MRAGAPPKWRHKMNENTPREPDASAPPDLYIPPADDAERQVLAAVVTEGNLKPAEGLSPSDLLDHLNGRILSAAHQAARDAGPGGRIILDKLREIVAKDAPAGEPSGVVARLEVIAGMEALPPRLLAPYVAAVKEQALKRDLVRYHLKSAQGIERGEVDISRHLTEAPDLFRAWSVLPSVEVKPVSAVLEEIDKRILDPGTKPVPTFSAMLNKNLNGGLQRKKVLTIVAPAGAGKTTFALQLLEETVQAHQADDAVTVGVYISMEMAAEELVTKSYSRLGRLNSGHIEGKMIKDNPAEMAKLENARELYRSKCADFMYIVEAPVGMNIDAVRWYAHSIKERLGRLYREVFVVLCVDPFQRLRTGKDEIDADETSRVGELASDLKKLARDEDISVVLLSDTTKAATQTTEEGFAAGGTAPRGSYMITHVTDLLAELRVIMPKADKGSKKGAPDENLEALEKDLPRADCGWASLPVYAVLDFSKNRSGGVKDCRFVWQKAYNRFIPIGAEQIGLDGKTVEKWRARWHLEAADE